MSVSFLVTPRTRLLAFTLIALAAVALPMASTAHADGPRPAVERWVAFGARLQPAGPQCVAAPVPSGRAMAHERLIQTSDHYLARLSVEVDDLVCYRGQRLLVAIQNGTEAARIGRIAIDATGHGVARFSSTEPPGLPVIREGTVINIVDTRNPAGHPIRVMHGVFTRIDP